MGGLNFLLRCNYDTKYLKHLPIFYRNILEYFRDLKSLYGSNQAQDIILFNNKDILVGETPVYISEWFKKGIVSIRDLLNDDGNFLTFQEFTDKYPRKTTYINLRRRVTVKTILPTYIVYNLEYIINISLNNKKHLTTAGLSFQKQIEQATNRSMIPLIASKPHEKGPSDACNFFFVL